MKHLFQSFSWCGDFRYSHCSFVRLLIVFCCLLCSTLPTISATSSNSRNALTTYRHLVEALSADADPAKGLPRVPFWSDDGNTVLWEPWMTRQVYQKCDLKNRVWGMPIPGVEILSLARNFPGAGALSAVAYGEVRRYASMSKDEFQHRFENEHGGGISIMKLAKDFTARPRFSYAIIVLSIIMVIVGLVVLCTMCQCCRNCCSTIWCKLCCGYRERLSLHEYPLWIKVSTLGCTILFIVGVIITLSLATAFATYIPQETHNTFCQLYRAPHTITFGVTYDQSQYLSKAGRENIVIGRQWDGVTELRSALSELKANLTEPDTPGTLTNRAKVFSNDVTVAVGNLLDGEDRDLTRFEKSLKRTKEELGKVTDNFHMCMLCNSAESEEVKPLLENAHKELQKQKTDIQDFSKTINDELINNPSLKDAAQITDDVRDITADMSKYIEKIYDLTGSKEDIIIDVANYAKWASLAITGISLFIFVFFCIAVCCIGNKYRQSFTTHSAPLTGVLTFTWCSMFLWTAVILFITGILLIGAGIAAEPCLLGDELIVKGGYEQYPLVVERASNLLGKGYTDTVKILNSVASLTGDGDISGIVNIDEAKSKVEEGLNEARNQINELKTKTVENLDKMEVGTIYKNLTELQWMFLPDYSLQRDLGTFPEVIFSGLQLQNQPISTELKKKIEEKIQHTTLKVPPVIYGFEAAENKINEFVKKATGGKVYCFGHVTKCSQESNVMKTVDESYKVGTDTEVQSWKGKGTISDVEFVGLTVGMEWMVRKLNIFKQTPFIVVDVNGNEKRVAYETFVTPGTSTEAELNKLSNDLSIQFQTNLETEVDKVSNDANHLVNDFSSVTDDAFDRAEVTRSFISEALTVKDPVCKGVIGSISSLAIVWVTLAVLQIIGGILAYKMWHYMKDLETQEHKLLRRQSLLAKHGDQITYEKSPRDIEVFVSSAELMPMATSH